MVIRLTHEVPINTNYGVYFENYYMSVSLMIAFYQKEILCVGTVRHNKIPNCKLPNTNFFKKQIHGMSYEHVTSYKGTPLSNIV